MHRICSQHGNVIAADFRPRPWWETATVTFRTETIYFDDHVTLIRVSAAFDGKPEIIGHVVGDLATGRLVQL